MATKNVDYKKAFETLVSAIQLEKESWQESFEMSSASHDEALNKFDFSQADYHWRTMLRYKALVDLCDKFHLESVYIRTGQVYDAEKVAEFALNG